ncbi:DNA repair protein RadC [Candidatus Atribacteria bacterium 1244-E10-H5-B2]|nr:MAG: DNA repair protein RadC [Candidatus Atribacteria bacterium 1244-E10-H5-B2]
MYIKCKSDIKISDCGAVAEVFYDVLKNEDEVDQTKEHFWAMGLNTKNRVLYLELVSLGTLTEGLIHPREVFKSAIIKSVAGLIFCHNHPSGESEPSGNDIQITQILKEGGKILGIKILDHIILGDKNIFSFQSEGMLGV